MLSRLVITLFPRSKHLLISWLHSPSVVILEPPKINFLTVSIVSPSICHEVSLDAMILVFWMLSFKPTFHSLLSPSSINSLVLLYFLPWGLCHLHIWGYWYFSRQPRVYLEFHLAWHFTWYTLHVISVRRVTIYSFGTVLSQFWTSLLSTSGYKCCFLIYIQVSQEAA